MSIAENKDNPPSGDAGNTSDATVETGREEKTAHEFGEAPDGGLRAWLVAIGAAFITFASMGFANSFGVFQEYYMTHQLRGRSADTIAWIGSLTAFFQFFAGAIGGPLFDRYGAWLIRPATILCVFATMMVSLCDEYWQFILAQGLLLGLTMGFMQFPAFAAVAQFFDKKRAAALGLAVAGSSVGGVVFPIALSKMLNSSSLGFGWSVRIIAFVMLPTLGFSCFTVRARLPPRPTNFFIATAFKQVDFILLVAALLFMFLGMMTPLFFIPTYAVTKGMDATLASYLLAILNAASTFGRIIPGIMADKFGRTNILALGGISTGVVILCLTKAESTAALVVYSVFFGFVSGTIISGGSAALTGCVKDPRDIGTYMGTGLSISSIAVLIGPPINGRLEHVYGGFFEVSIFSGVMCLVGGLIAFVSKVGTSHGILGRT
ncbi:MFS general substrate transporter [Pleurostoma richardsiae]|uniref:MFS general substrate transporter n=1 Tax=Pleurostoma richardsiae TaxID=41990 RepID=A0AA38VFQ7_9PEZI|nr:MFS general substrate transporter [Pleurostoma richardsiae]